MCLHLLVAAAQAQALSQVRKREKRKRSDRFFRLFIRCFGSRGPGEEEGRSSEYVDSHRPHFVRSVRPCEFLVAVPVGSASRRPLLPPPFIRTRSKSLRQLLVTSTVLPDIAKPLAALTALFPTPPHLPISPSTSPFNNGRNQQFGCARSSRSRRRMHRHVCPFPLLLQSLVSLILLSRCRAVTSPFLHLRRRVVRSPPFDADHLPPRQPLDPVSGRGEIGERGAFLAFFPLFTRRGKAERVSFSSGRAPVRQLLQSSSEMGFRGCTTD
jgi:hypothetical protein